MANPTTNFGWQMPTSSDLVTDLPADFEVFGQAVDTALVDLKGGTTGQVLSKTSNTDMDFTWVTTDDTNAIQNAIVDAKGDLIAASAADTPARLAVGNNGETLVADSSQAVGLAWAGNYAAGKNKLINGDFYINQRSFTSTTTSSTYGQDRWQLLAAGGTSTYSAETFTPGAAPVAGYEGKSFARLVSTGQSAAADRTVITQRIEDVRTFAGQTVTLSFWAKASTGTPSVAADFAQGFGTSGSSTVNVAGQKTAITSSWARYSLTFAIPSISGKTIGTGGDQLQLRLWTSAGSDWNTFTNTLGIQSVTIDIWGVQVEAGSVTTAFQTATGSIQGELAACQRYYYRTPLNSASSSYFIAGAYSTTAAVGVMSLPVSLRTSPTLIDTNSLRLFEFATGSGLTAATFTVSGTQSVGNTMEVTATYGSAAFTAGRTYLVSANGATGFIGFGAEL